MSDSDQYFPDPVIKLKELDEKIKDDLISQGAEDWIADIFARRIETSVSVESIFNPVISKIEDPKTIPSIDIAVSRIVKAIVGKEMIVFACDHDMDGTASAAVLWRAFLDYFKHPKECLKVVTSHRLTEGYGITMPVAKRILEANASLVITADKGSSDEERILFLKDAGVDVIVTDHHEIPVEGPPESAIATVNPAREGSTYDPYICGAAVAFLTMAKVRSALLEQGYIKSISSLVGLLDYVAVATIADCVSMRPDKSYANRAFVRAGLKLINQKSRPCWSVFLKGRQGTVFSDDIGFYLAPPIAAAGRLDWAESGFLFLISESLQEAEEHWQHLISENTKRKAIEKGLREKANEIALNKHGQSIVVYLEDGHSGVHGISAGRLVQAFGKPSAIFSAKCTVADESEAPILASGSFRSIPGLHIRDALQYVEDKNPGLLIGFGGHMGAAGASILINKIDRFETAFEEAVVHQVGTLPLAPIIWVDGDLPGSWLNLKILDQLMAIDPWGREFLFPLFKGEFEIESCQPVGDGSHLRFSLSKDGVCINAIWFYAHGQGKRELGFYVGDKATFVYKLTDNWFRGRRSAQLIIECVESSLHNN